MSPSVVVNFARNVSGAVAFKVSGWSRSGLGGAAFLGAPDLVCASATADNRSTKTTGRMRFHDTAESWILIDYGNGPATAQAACETSGHSGDTTWCASCLPSRSAADHAIEEAGIRCADPPASGASGLPSRSAPYYAIEKAGGGPGNSAAFSAAGLSP